MQFAVALGFALVLFPLARWLGLATGLVDHPGDPLKIHAAPIPLSGGVAAAAAAAVALAVLGRPLSPWIGGAIGLALIAGLADDVRHLPPSVRLLAQAGAGVMLVGGGIRLETLGALGPAAVVLAAVACANAVNLLDGQDGLAGGLGAIAALGLALLLSRAGETAMAGLGLAAAGALVAFLFWNLPPARIFLGNGGAYAVGTALAALAGTTGGEGWSELLAAGVCLGVLAFELGFTVARRMGARDPLAAGDRLHAYDLVALRLGVRARSTALFWALGALAAGLAVVVARAPLAVGAALTAAGLVGAVLWGARLWAAQRRGLRLA